jgi:hypothetical protein
MRFEDQVHSNQRLTEKSESKVEPEFLMKDLPAVPQKWLSVQLTFGKSEVWFMLLIIGILAFQSQWALLFALALYLSQRLNKDGER